MYIQEYTFLRNIYIIIYIRYLVHLKIKYYQIKEILLNEI